MKTTTFLLVMLIAAQGLKAQVTHTVTESGFAYNPATLTILIGESVKFEGSTSHPILQVSETTWTANGTASLQGGFAFASGSGTVNFPVAGTYYYVCTAHVASQGMKGKIIVQAPTALNEVTQSEKFAVFPVPLTGNELIVALKTTGHQYVSVDIYDMAGTLKTSSQGIATDGKYLIGCSSLPKGMFLMKINADGSLSYAKIVRE